MQLHRLHMEGKDLTMAPVWAMPELLDNCCGFSCEVFWAPNDAWALVLHAGRNLRTAYDALDTNDGNTYVMHSLGDQHPGRGRDRAPCNTRPPAEAEASALLLALIAITCSFNGMDAAMVMSTSTATKSARWYSVTETQMDAIG